MHVRRGAARLAAVLLLTAGAVVAGPAALAQEADPCAPAADGSVPEMCQGGMAPEPAPEPDPCAPDAEGTAPEMCQGGEVPETDPTDPCPAQPVEPGDGVVTDEGDQGIAVGEPNPGAPPSDVESDPAAEGEVKPEPAPEEPATRDPMMSDPGPSAVGEDGIICAFGVPVSAPVDSAAGGGVTAVPDAAAPEAAVGGGNTAVAAGQLPRTGPKERVLALAAGGVALLLLGAGTLAAARRREVAA